MPISGLSAGTRIPCPSCGCEIQVLDDASVRVHGEFAVGDTIAGPSDVAQDAQPMAAVGGGAPVAIPPPPAPDLPPPPQKQGESPIPGYVVQEELGRGGMAVVFKARQISLDRIVALKIMAERLAEDSDFVKRFEREAKALAALNHPNITSVYDRGQSGKKIFFVMEFVKGLALRDVLEEAGGRIPQERALQLMIQVAEALAYVHERGTIHRDIKPENVLVTPEDVVKVTDFGLAAMVDEGVNHNLTGANMMMGTLNYMPPEQRADAKSVDHRADIYSFGVMLYEVLTGTVPLGKWSPATELVPELDFRLDEIIAECLKNNRNDRYQSITDARDALKEVLEGPGQSLELNIPLMGADVASTPPAPARQPPPPEPARVAPTQEPAAPRKTVTPSRTPKDNFSDPGPSAGASRNAELESLVAQAKANMQVQRTRGMPTRVQQFPGIDPPKRRGRIFLISLLAMVATLLGGYVLFEGPVLVAFLIRTSPAQLREVKNESLRGFLGNLRKMAQSRARELSISQPNAFRPALSSDSSEKVKAGLALLSRSPHPDAANLVGNLLHHEDDEIYRWAVEALRRMASNQSAPAAARTAARTELTRATVGGDPKRVGVVKSVLRRLEESEAPGEAGSTGD